MKLKTWLVLLSITGAVIAGYTWHVRSQGKIEGRIEERTPIIKQAAKSVARKQKAFRVSHKAYILKPSLDTCRPALSDCKQLHEADSTQIELLEQQINDLNALNNRSKLFGFLPRPTLQVGACVDQRLHPSLCLSAGFPITH